MNYIVAKTVRLGVGYGFTRFFDDEFQSRDEDHGGTLFRVVGSTDSAPRGRGLE